MAYSYRLLPHAIEAPRSAGRKLCTGSFKWQSRPLPACGSLMDGPRIRKGQGSVKISREQFEVRLKERFADPAYDAVAPEIRRVLEVDVEVVPPATTRWIGMPPCRRKRATRRGRWSPA
jgi:hypothetical protein